MTPWLAAFTRRWHCNPDLAHTVDPVGYHGGRMGILALYLWREDASRDLLLACLCHDLGESVTGDIPHTAKQDDKLARLLYSKEQSALLEMGMAYFIDEEDQRRLKFLDRLDAYLWARHHAPHVLPRDGWPEALAWLQREADELGAIVEAIMAEASA